MIQVNPQQLMDDGFIILRGIVPPEQLQPLRDSFEILIERQKAIWRRDRKPGDPPGGVGDTAHNPRLDFDTLVDQATANTVEFCLHENTMGISRQLLRAPEAAIYAFNFFFNPVRDRGPGGWHRDISPSWQGPLNGLVMNMLANGPNQVRWSIALYDDDVFEAVPGSHRRPNTDVENRQLLENGRGPVSGSLPQELKAGDALVRINTHLHRGSYYGTTKRRTMHIGYRPFGGAIFPCARTFQWDLGFTKHLSVSARETLEHFAKLLAQEYDVIASTFRAIIDKDADAFREGLATLQPGETGQIVAVVTLCKEAYKLYTLQDANVAGLPPDERAEAIYVWSQVGLKLLEGVAGRFSASEIDTLWGRFAVLDAKLKADEIQVVPGTPGKNSYYKVYDMPADFDVEDFIASWGA